MTSPTPTAAWPMLPRFLAASGARHLAWLGAGLLWIGAIAGGLGALAWYENIPAAAESIPRQWPSGSQIGHNREQATLVLFAHPKCPCTRASLGELEKIVAHSGKNLNVWVAFFKPVGAEAGWEQTDLWRSAEAIPGVHVFCDEGGAEAQRFHATTSGQALVYDRAGKLMFNGGITIARGHAGDNPGAEAVELLARGQSPGYVEVPVFGCSILPASETQ